MRSTYRFRAFLRSQYGAWWNQIPGPDLTREVLEGALRVVAVKALERADNGQWDVALELVTASHPDSLAAMRAGLQSLGWDVAQAIITDWVTAEAETAIVGAGVGGVGGLAARNPGAALLLAAIGAGVGLAVGSAMTLVKARYRADRLDNYDGTCQWRITPLTLPGTDGRQPQNI